MNATPPRSPRARPPHGRPALAPHSAVRAGGRRVAAVRADRIAGNDGVRVELRLDVAEGPQPAWARRLLLHDVLNRAQLEGIAHVTLDAPDDEELLDVLREHATAVDVARTRGRVHVDAQLPSWPRATRTGPAVRPLVGTR